VSKAQGVAVALTIGPIIADRSLLFRAVPDFGEEGRQSRPALSVRRLPRWSHHL